MRTKWERVAAYELLEAVADGNLDVLVPDASAVYMWKRRLRPPTEARHDGRVLVEWVDEQLDTPQGSVRSKRLGTFLTAERIDLRAARLPSSKSEILRRWTSKERNRKWLVNFLQDLSEHAPALYVGETGNLRNRVRDHLKGRTDFSGAVEVHFSWSDLDFFYYELGPPREAGTEWRRTIEYVTTGITIGGFTQRPG